MAIELTLGNELVISFDSEWISELIIDTSTIVSMQAQLTSQGLNRYGE